MKNKYYVGHKINLPFSGLEKPVLSEVGPYAYTQKLERVDLTFSNNDSIVSYKIATFYYYSRGKYASAAANHGNFSVDLFEISSQRGKNCFSFFLI